MKLPGGWESVQSYSQWYGWDCRLGVPHSGSATSFHTRAFFIPDEGIPMSHRVNRGIPWTVMTEEGKTKGMLGKLAFSGMQEASSKRHKGDFLLITEML